MNNASRKRKALRWPKWRTAVTVLEILAAPVTIAAYLFGDPFGGVPRPWDIVSGLLGFLLVAVVSLWLFWKSALRFSSQLTSLVDYRLTESKTSVERAISQQVDLGRMKSAIHQLSHVIYELKKIPGQVADVSSPAEEARQLLHESLREADEVFSRLCQRQCRLTIKLIYSAEARYPGSKGRAVITAARSTTPHRDKARKWPDLIDQNSDFKAIIAGEPYWFSNDINKVKGYSNSSVLRPYRSVIVWGVRSLEKRGVTKESQRGHLGFLCLDSTSPRAFELDRELVLGWWYVDVLGSVLAELEDILDKMY